MGRFRCRGRPHWRAFCTTLYERAIEKAGGIDLQILGIGRTGHIGFNEPGSPRDSRTRMVTLDPVTRRDAASDFFGEENVPVQALTMGVGTILEARKIVIIALGEHKARIVRKALEEPISEEVTASFLQTHRNATFALDLAAASDLTAMQTPWLVGPVRWNLPLEKRCCRSGLVRSSKSPCSSSKRVISPSTGCTTSSAIADRWRRSGSGSSPICWEGFARGPRETSGRKSSCSADPHPDDDVDVDGGHPVHAQ